MWLMQVICSFFIRLAITGNKSALQTHGNCERKCFTFQLGNTECKIICDPPVIEQAPPAPAFNWYPQQAVYGQSQQYLNVGQMQAQPSPMYADNTQAQQYSNPAVFPTISAKPSPVQEGCVGRSCDQPKSQSDKPKKQEQQDKQAPAAPKPSKASGPYTIQVPCNLCVLFCFSMDTTLYGV